ncbi:MAG: NADH-quinone oxidoreductase subunit NuoK [Prevotellaceae bacterium]|jgi:NADH-quinone oxidoreductase subunit K|nr:NADH-quinone oxidoreductase subunit NuoK [Prevotellaceae bacterium]
MLNQFFGNIIPLEGYIVVGLIMFFAGIYGFISRKSLMMILISVELILNAADLNFAAFNRYLFPEHSEGLFFALFTIVIAACETAVAIAIIINIYRNLNNIDVDALEAMQEPESDFEKIKF